MATPAQNIILGSPAQRNVVARHFNADKIIRLILYADGRSAEFINADNLAALQGSTQYQTLCNIYNFVKSNVHYRPDPLAREWVRSPGYLMQSGIGDCKSLSLAIASLCRAFRIPYKYRFIRQAGKSSYHHVYVVAYPLDGSCRRPVVLDAVNKRFDSEPAYVRKLDVSPRTSAGTAAVGSVAMESGAVLLALVAAWFLFATPTKKRRKSA
jgi:hypothetical protein